MSEETWDGLGRARQLLADTERLAQTITTPAVGNPHGFRAWALREIVTALSGLDPAEAERVARTIPDPLYQAKAFTDVAGALVKVDPGRARELLAEAERIVPRTDLVLLGCRALVAVVGVLADLDPEDAERVAWGIADPAYRVHALTEVAGALAGVDAGRARDLLAQAEDVVRSGSLDEPERALAWVAGVLTRLDPGGAERLARTIAEPYAQGRALREVVTVLAESEPDDAERLAFTIGHRLRRAQALTLIARALAASNAERARGLLIEAERLARTVPRAWWQARALMQVASALIAVDVERARDLLAEAEQIARTDSHPDPVLEDAAQALARIDPGDAERLARSIRRPANRNNAQKKVAEEMALADPDNAVRLAHTIPSLAYQCRALAGIARVWGGDLRWGHEVADVSAERCRA
ncbi:coiled-coil domain-containing protein [Actinomadura soli]|uniref:hypothetical protein n=1 Tax=Actinomadura soli TaxID=2508997 RepID=UPI00148688DD|nr:hypothetical protein [Actinomadura soli]